MSKKRILLVDDEPIVAKLYSRALSNAGFDVLFACDGIEGFDIAREERVDLILTDMQMPGRTGAQLADALSARALKRCPILLLSATDSGEGLVSAVEAGCDDFMQKGDSFGSIMNRVDFWLSAPFAALPDDARAIFIEQTPLLGDQITALRRLSRERWQMEERTVTALKDQLFALNRRTFRDGQMRRRLLGVCAGLLDHLGRSDTLSYLRRGDLMLATLKTCLEDQISLFRDDLAGFAHVINDATYRHAKETLILSH